MDAFEIRTWLAERVGCQADDLRFAGTTSLRSDQQVVCFSLDGERRYQVTIVPRFAFGRRRHWQLTAAWPTGSAIVTTPHEPRW